MDCTQCSVNYRNCYKEEQIRMEAEAEKYYNQRNVNKIVYNDLLGYAICYYHPTVDSDLPLNPPQENCEPNRHPIDDRIDEAFYEEIGAMVRRREHGDADKALRKICEKVHELYSEVEQDDLKHRDVLNFRVREQIKGKSAAEICDILVKDVLNHTKAIFHPKAIDFQKKPSKNNSLSNTVFPTSAKVEENLISAPKEPKVFQRVENILEEDLQSQVHHRKYIREIKQIKNELMYLKRRCTEKIDFNY